VGGFATVWLYHDAELRSDVAVKALAENWAQRLDVRERFLEEARILRQADSDHIVRVYDIGEADGTPYFVMTYADLGSLADVLERERVLPTASVLDLVAQAGAGLSVLHEHGVVHRDIKPQNLLLRSGGSTGPRLLVADLGVAKAMLHASGLTQVVGTPAYMAPEQAVGVGIDIRADVHALGAVTYQMLTGSLARTGSIGELARATLPARPSSLADLSSAVDDVLLRALEPDPEDRWPDVASYVAALRAALPSQVPGVEDQLTLWHVPDRRGAAGTELATPAPRGPLWPTVLISLLAFVAAFALAYVAATTLR
jgi:serine/threonine protein kinase